MKTFPINDSTGRLQSFEIENNKISRKRASYIIATVSVVIMRRYPKKILSWLREDIFCEFEINSIQFQIEQPFGYNSRYWIGRSDRGRHCEELQIIENIFRNTR